MSRRGFLGLIARNAATATLWPSMLRAAKPEADGLGGEYGFLSPAVMGPQSEAGIRSRIAAMAQDYGIREFQFYDWFADYSTPVAGEHWTDPYFHRIAISRQTIRSSIDEVHRQGGRAWAYVQAIGAEETNLDDPKKGLFKLLDPKGKWYWHPGNAKKPRFPTYFANAAWAEHMVTRWADSVQQLGFDGIHWDTLGRIAGDYGAETIGMHDFIRTTHQLLQPHGLRQTMNMVDLAWWDRQTVRQHLEFPYAETWSYQTAGRYFAEMDQPDMAGIRGVWAMYPTVLVPADSTATEVICKRHHEGREHHLSYLIVGDGARRMKNEYWPDTVPLNAAESACLQTRNSPPPR